MTRVSRLRMAGVPRAAKICALIATLNGACWSIVTPPFQVPDEPSHYAYTQELAERRHLPVVGPGRYSEAEAIILGDLHQNEVRWHPETPATLSAAEARRLQRDLGRPLSPRAGGKPGVSASQPPLYYALQIVPYGVGRLGTLLDQLELMRLLSALMGGLTAMFVFLFLREALPGASAAWTVGGLSAALMPLLGFMSGSVNPDAMLFAVSAAVFYCLARAFRGGLTRGMAFAIGALTATGFLTKLNFVGLVPGVILGLIVLSLKASRNLGKLRAVGLLGLALTVALAPVAVYLLVNLLLGHQTLGIGSAAIDSTGHRGSLSQELSYIWQFYLPRLPWMSKSYFPGLLVARDLWFDRGVGLYGWLDTSFPSWASTLALIPTALIAALAIRGALLRRSALRARLGELSVYLVMSIALLGLIGADSYLSVGSEGSGYVQPRYLLPLLPLLAGVPTLAARGAGRRLGPAVGTLIVVVFVGYDLFSQMLELSRFYG